MVYVADEPDVASMRALTSYLVPDTVDENIVIGEASAAVTSIRRSGVPAKAARPFIAVDTEVHDNFVIAPDSGTNITAQITSLTSSTVNVDAIVSVLG